MKPAQRERLKIVYDIRKQELHHGLKVNLAKGFHCLVGDLNDGPGDRDLPETSCSIEAVGRHLWLDVRGKQDIFQAGLPR